MPKSEQLSLDSVRGFITFLSFSGNGHSLISSMLDAHENIIISREVKILKHIYNGSDRDKMLKEIINHSKQYSAKGRPHKGSNTSHFVEGQLNGSAKRLKFLGDKNGYGTVHQVLYYKNFFKKCEALLRMPIIPIHIYRNPFRVVEHTRRFYSFRNIDDTATKVSERFHKVRRSLSRVKNAVSIKFENILCSTDKTLLDLFKPLGIRPSDKFLGGCRSIITSIDEPPVMWTPKSIKLINELCSSISYLNGYRYES